MISQKKDNNTEYCVIGYCNNKIKITKGVCERQYLERKKQINAESENKLL